MADTLTPEQRTLTMRRVRGRNTKPELIVRSVLHRMGYRFSLKSKDLPGKPDIVLPKRNAVVFVHGCFWHRHPRCRRASIPQTNQEYWLAKFQKNVKRDKAAQHRLRQLGWTVIVVWECEIAKDPARLAARRAN